MKGVKYQRLNNNKKHLCGLLSVKLALLILILPLTLCVLFFRNNFSTNTHKFEPLSTNYTLINKLETPFSKKNLIFIGDVHGSYDELLMLINKIKYDPLKDHLIFVGDLVAKGPKSIEVVQLIRTLGASCVRGNHDNKVLKIKNILDFSGSQKIPLDEFIKEHDLPKDIVKSEHGLLAKELDVELYNYLLSCPIILDIPEYDLYIVHGGLLPDVPLFEQDPSDIMNMRNIKKNGIPTSKKDEGHAWSKYWNAVQEKSSSPKTVIYGHDAGRGLKIKPYSFGLDSRCVYGGELSALIWNSREIISVKCSKYAD